LVALMGVKSLPHLNGQLYIAATFRSSWVDAEGWFVGFMGGFNGRSVIECV